MADERESRSVPAEDDHLALELDDETKPAIAELKRQLGVGQKRPGGEGARSAAADLRRAGIRVARDLTARSNSD